MKTRYPLLSFIAVSILLAPFVSLDRAQPLPASSSRESKEELKLDVPYEPSADEVVEDMLKIAGVTKEDLVYDLGCGDGRVVITAAQKRGARGVGMDLDPQRIGESLENARRAGVADRVRFFRQDLFETDIRPATVVMLYLWPEVNLRLRPRILSELKPGTRVVSHSHNMGTWEPDRSITASNGHKVYFWVVPANVSGSWKVQRPGADETAPWFLKFEQSFQKVTGTLRAGSEEADLIDVELRGDSLTFKTLGKADKAIRSLQFQGRVAGNHLEGTLEDISGQVTRKQPWSAERDPSTIVLWD